jgi:Cys-tRNA(Pro)/Cys-tRNA(Cys) deacylase
MTRKAHAGGVDKVGTPATLALDRAGIVYRIHTYDTTAVPHHTSNHMGTDKGHHDGYGIEVAAALGQDAHQVFKTLIAEVDGRLTVGVVPVVSHLDLKALATVCGAKRAAMADPAVAERSSGYVVGGISPVGQRRSLPTVIDSSARALATMYVSAGRRGAQLALAPGDLADLLDAAFADIAR